MNDKIQPGEQEYIYESVTEEEKEYLYKMFGDRNSSGKESNKSDRAKMLITSIAITCLILLNIYLTYITTS